MYASTYEEWRTYQPVALLGDCIASEQQSGSQETGRRRGQWSLECRADSRTVSQTVVDQQALYQSTDRLKSRTDYVL